MLLGEGRFSLRESWLFGAFAGRQAFLVQLDWLALRLICRLTRFLQTASC